MNLFIHAFTTPYLEMTFVDGVVVAVPFLLMWVLWLWWKKRKDEQRKKAIGECEYYWDHEPVWGGDGYVCRICMIPFEPHTKS